MIEDIMKYVQERAEEAIEEKKNDPAFRQQAETFIREGREALIRLESWLDDGKPST